jgi:hypothetical protein
MKKLFTVLTTAVLFAACSSDSDLDAKKDVVLTDTAGMYKSNYSTDVSTPVEDPQEKTVAPTKIIRETRVVYVDRTPKTKKPVYHEATPVNPVVTQPQPQQQESNTQTSSSGNPTDNTGVNTGNTGGSGTETTSDQPAKKEGWNNSVKGAVIGGVGGAVLGAVISKKKGKGAIIGGVLGAAGGYILGKKKDKANDANQVTDANYVSY